MKEDGSCFACIEQKNSSFNLITPCILDKHQAKGGLLYGMSSVEDGDMSIMKNPQLATQRRQAFVDSMSEKFGCSSCLDITKGVYMLPNLEPPVIANYSDSKQIISGPEAIVFNEPLIAIMQPMDCPPVFLYDKKSTSAAFYHGSYHSVDRFYLKDTLSLMADKYDTLSEDVVTLVGPGIGRGWFRRRYLLTSNPEIWEGSIDTWNSGDEVAYKVIRTNEGDKGVFFPKSNFVLREFFNNSRLGYMASRKVVDVADYVLSQFKQEVPQLSINLQKVIVAQLISLGVNVKNIEVDEADTFQNAQRGLMYSHQAEYRKVAKCSGNPIAVFGKV